MRVAILAALLLLAAVLAEGVAAQQDDDFEDEEDYEATSTSVFKSNKQILTLEPGDTAVLHCVFEGEFGVTWLIGDKALAINRMRFTLRDDKRLTFYDNNTLRITNLQEADEGAYTCKLGEEMQLHHYVNIIVRETGINLAILLGAIFLSLIIVTILILVYSRRKQIYHSIVKREDVEM